MLTTVMSRGLAAAAVLVAALLVPGAAASADPVKICNDKGHCWIEITDPGEEGGGDGEVRVPPPSPGPEYLWSQECWRWYLPGDPICGIIAPPGADPDALAEQAVAMLKLGAPEIGIVPRMGPGRMGVVGAPVWMWTPPGQWDPLTATATAGGLSVTASAQLEYVDWDMGDGRTVRCDTPGKEYQRGYGLAMSPECGHRYEHTSIREPNMEYTVTATAHYAVTWAGAVAGSQVVELDSTTPLRIGEIQALVVDG